MKFKVDFANGRCTTISCDSNEEAKKDLLSVQKRFNSKVISVNDQPIEKLALGGVLLATILGGILGNQVAKSGVSKTAKTIKSTTKKTISKTKKEIAEFRSASSKSKKYKTGGSTTNDSKFYVKSNFGNWSVIDRKNNKMVVGYSKKEDAMNTSIGLNNINNSDELLETINKLKTIKGYGHFLNKFATGGGIPSDYMYKEVYDYIIGGDRPKSMATLKKLTDAKAKKMSLEYGQNLSINKLFQDSEEVKASSENYRYVKGGRVKTDYMGYNLETTIQSSGATTTIASIDGVYKFGTFATGKENLNSIEKMHDKIRKHNKSSFSKGGGVDERELSIQNLLKNEKYPVNTKELKFLSDKSGYSMGDIEYVFQKKNKDIQHNPEYAKGGKIGDEVYAYFTHNYMGYQMVESPAMGEVYNGKIIDVITENNTKKYVLKFENGETKKISESLFNDYIFKNKFAMGGMPPQLAIADQISKRLPATTAAIDKKFADRVNPTQPSMWEDRGLQKMATGGTIGQEITFKHWTGDIRNGVIKEDLGKGNFEVSSGFGNVLVNAEDFISPAQKMAKGGYTTPSYNIKTTGVYRFTTKDKTYILKSYLFERQNDTEDLIQIQDELRSELGAIIIKNSVWSRLSKGFPVRGISSKGNITGTLTRIADTIDANKYAKGGSTNERNFVNKNEDYEVRYARKNNPFRVGYKGNTKFKTGGSVENYKIVAFEEDPDYNYYVVDEDEDNYLTVQNDMFNKWKNANKFDRATYYSEWIPKSEMVVIKKMKKGGGIDLFEDYDKAPPAVAKLMEKYEEVFEDGDYEKLAEAHKAFEKIGYTFDYYLDGVAYDLRPIGTKGKAE